MGCVIRIEVKTGSNFEFPLGVQESMTMIQSIHARLNGETPTPGAVATAAAAVLSPNGGNRAVSSKARAAPGRLPPASIGSGSGAGDAGGAAGAAGAGAGGSGAGATAGVGGGGGGAGGGGGGQAVGGADGGVTTVPVAGEVGPNMVAVTAAVAAAGMAAVAAGQAAASADPTAVNLAAEMSSAPPPAPAQGAPPAPGPNSAPTSAAKPKRAPPPPPPTAEMVAAKSVVPDKFMAMLRAGVPKPAVQHKVKFFNVYQHSARSRIKLHFPLLPLRRPLPNPVQLAHLALTFPPIPPRIYRRTRISPNTELT